MYQVYRYDDISLMSPATLKWPRIWVLLTAGLSKLIRSDDCIGSPGSPLYFWTFQWELGKIRSAIVNQNFNVAVSSPLRAVGDKEIIGERQYWAIPTDAYLLLKYWVRTLKCIWWHHVFPILELVREIFLKNYVNICGDSLGCSYRSAKDNRCFNLNI